MARTTAIPSKILFPKHIRLLQNFKVRNLSLAFLKPSNDADTSLPVAEPWYQRQRTRVALARVVCGAATPGTERILVVVLIYPLLVYDDATCASGFNVALTNAFLSRAGGSAAHFFFANEPQSWGKNSWSRSEGAITCGQDK